ncbi:MAG TPA: tetratricopeptide repeat protein [Alphaproteobacteria bacterium]|nr:tetratricopeptide repeat protein [Alphaproteobacteria bacterium]
MLPAISVAAVLISAPPRVHAAETEQQVVPPPVPFYASHVNKTALLAPGIVVIDTDDSFDTVLSWYRANLKDRTADVTLGPQHQHFLTHTGAGVDISATGGGRRKTKISLLWKPTGSGGYAALPAEKPEQKPASAPAPAPAPEENVLQTFPAAEPPVAEEPVPTKIALEALQPKVSIEPARGQIALPRLRTRVVAVPPIPAPPAGEASVPRRETRGAESPGAETERAGTRRAGPKGLAFFRTGQYAEALLAWEDAAEAGSTDAALFLGMMYDAGEGVPQSYSQALNWYRMAAEGGSVAGSFNLGAMYDAGLGVRQDPASAAVWYARAAAKGSGRAAFNLALLFKKGDGVAQDTENAVKYFRQAARLGVTAARGHLGERRFASADDADQSFNTVHVIAADTPKGRGGDTAESIEAAAGRGDPAAEYNLAYRLERGTSGEIDLRRAYSLYVRAAAAASDSRLRSVADAGARQVKAHLEAARP